MRTKKITTKINEKHVDENGILHVRILEGAYIDLPSIIEDHEADFILTGHKNVLALIDSRAFFVVTPEARNYVNSDIMNKTRIATAVLTNNNIAIRILMNGFMKINKPRSHFKIFSDDKEAVDWLLSFKKSA